VEIILVFLPTQLPDRGRRWTNDRQRSLAANRKQINTVHALQSAGERLKATYLIFLERRQAVWPTDLDKLQARCEVLVKEIGGASVPLHHWENIIRLRRLHSYAESFAVSRRNIDSSPAISISSRSPQRHIAVTDICISYPAPPSDSCGPVSRRYAGTSPRVRRRH